MTAEVNYRDSSSPYYMQDVISHLEHKLANPTGTNNTPYNIPAQSPDYFVQNTDFLNGEQTLLENYFLEKEITKLERAISNYSYHSNPNDFQNLQVKQEIANQQFLSTELPFQVAYNDVFDSNGYLKILPDNYYYSNHTNLTLDQRRFHNNHRYARSIRNPILNNIFNKYGTQINEASKTYNLDPNLIATVICIESSGNPNSVSIDGAQGLMQLMPGTASDLGVTDPFDERQNIMGGSRYLQKMLRDFNGDIDLALAGYNAGPRRTREYLQGRRNLPGETRDYITKFNNIYANNHNLTLASNITTGNFINPVKGQFRISSGFGPRIKPRPDASSNHKGLDMAAARGTTVIASDTGTVAFAGRRGGYGNIVIIDHGDGTTSRYGHLDKIFVSQGETVAQGVKVGEVGSTGTSTGNHLHFEIRRDGRAINPIRHIGLA